jgi:photosystem II stability/assembly factor-like uncharacterized protein
MKSALAWAAVVCLALLLGVFGSSIGLAAQGETAGPTPSPTPRAFSPEIQLTWESLRGPSERVTYAVAAGLAGKTLYAGTWGHGVYRSSDRGSSWTRVGPDRRRLVKALAVLPSSDRTVYAGTYSEGLLRSTDGGLTWTQLGNSTPFRELDATHLDRSPFYVESLLILAERGGNSVVLAGTRNGIWASGAFSETWTHLTAGFADSDRAYSIQALSRSPNGWLFAGTMDGLYSSQDDGRTWRLTGPPDGYPDASHSIFSLAVITDAIHSSGTLLIGTGGAGVYSLSLAESNPGSQPWITNTLPLTDTRARTIQALLAAPDGTAYAGTVDAGVFETHDGGLTWEQRTEGLPAHARSILSLSRDPLDGTVYAGTYGDGVYRLPRAGERWEPAKGQPGKELPVDFTVQKVAFAGHEAERLLAGLEVGGLYSTSHQIEPDSPWARLSRALPIGPARDLRGLAVGGAGRSIVIAVTGAGVFRSADAGAEWTALTKASGLPAADLEAIGLAQGRADSGVLYVALKNAAPIYRSEDGGATWLSASGNLTRTQGSAITCLTVGEDDATVYVGQQFGQVAFTRDAGKTWQPATSISNTLILELQWSQRNWDDVRLHGGPQQMLYARTEKGIYVSYDSAASWQLRMRGNFTALLADPFRPHIVYAASPLTTLSREFAGATRLTPDLWISYDGGQTWRWAGTTPASITALALDPRRTDVLYAGTEGDGIFRATLPSDPQRFTPEGVAFFALATLLLTGALIAFQFWFRTGLTLGIPSGISFLGDGWFRLAWLRLTQGEEVGYVANTVTPLTALERLTLAHAAALRPKNDGVGAEEIQQALVSHDIPVTLIQVTRALNNLRSYRLIRAKERGYCLAYPLLGRIALARFWDATLKDQANRWARRPGKVLRVRYWETEAERARAIAEIRNESQLRAETREFFKQSGFETLPLETGGLRITSSRPEHGLLGAAQGIYVHLHTQDFLDADHIAQVQSNAAQMYDKQLAGKLAFLVASGPPRAKAGQDILRLRQDQEFRIVPLAREQMQRSGDPELARQVLARSLQRMMGNRDLFALDSRHLAPFDFVGREPLRAEILTACMTHRRVRLTGPFGVGKTALAWQIANQLPQTTTAWITVEEAELCCRWLGTIQPDGQRVAPETPGRRLSPEQVVDAVGRVRDRQRARRTELRVLAVLDELDTAGPAGADALAQGLAVMEGVSTLETLAARPPEEAAARTIQVGLLATDVSASLVAWLAAQMDIALAEAALQRIVAYGGGHPLLLRQLARLAVDQAERGSAPVEAAHVDQAIRLYVAQRGDVLGRIWGWFRPDERLVLRAATKPPVIPNELLLQLVNQGWLAPAEGNWRLFSPLLAAWLDAQAPAS